MYDAIRGSDEDEFDDEDSRTKKNASSSNKTASYISNAPSASPKQISQKKQQPQHEPLNLLASSMINNQKKKTSGLTPVKNVDFELENALNQVRKIFFYTERPCGEYLVLI